MALSRNSRGLHRATPRGFELSLSINSRAHPTRTTRFRRPCQKRRCCTLLPLGRKSFLLSFPAPRERKPATGHSMRRVLPSLPSSRRDDRALQDKSHNPGLASPRAPSLIVCDGSLSSLFIHSASQRVSVRLPGADPLANHSVEREGTTPRRGSGIRRFGEFSGTSPVTHAKSVMCIRVFRDAKLPNRSIPQSLRAASHGHTKTLSRWPPS